MRKERKHKTVSFQSPCMVIYLSQTADDKSQKNYPVQQVLVMFINKGGIFVQ